MKNLKRLFIYFKSMKFGIILLMLIIILSMLGTVIPQGLDEYFYSSNYSSLISSIVLLFSLNNIYNSVLFCILFAMLAINLIMCSITRLGKIIKGLKSNLSTNNMQLVEVEDVDLHHLSDISVEKAFKKYGLYKYSQDKSNSETYYAVKNKAGYFGSWFLHFGIFIVIVCYTYGNLTYFSEGIYGVPGTVQPLEGTDYKVRINDFKITYGEDESVQQYTTNIELLDNSGKILTASHVEVNDPMRFEGYNFYQTGYGWASKCNILKSGDSMLQETIYEKTSLYIPEKGIGIYFNKFYPDVAAISSNEYTALSNQLNNPVILYSVIYFGQVVKMDFISINETIKWNDYEFIFHSPQLYTYLEINKMNGQLGAGIGAFLITLGIVLVFYFKPVRMAICKHEGKLHIYKSSAVNKQNKNDYRKGNDIYAQ